MDNGLKQPLEDKEQVALVGWLEARGYFVFHIPNHKTMRQDMGAKPGMPDLQIVLSSEKVLWVEMKKRKGGRVEIDQAKVHKELREMDHTVIVAHGAKEAMEKITEHLERPSPQQALVTRLRAYQAWRRGGEGPQPEPGALGRDLDLAIDILSARCSIGDQSPN